MKVVGYLCSYSKRCSLDTPAVLNKKKSVAESYSYSTRQRKPKMNPKKLCLWCVSSFLVILGLFFIIISQKLLKYLIKSNLVLTPNSKVYESWQQTPFLISMDIYLFNWTNPGDINNKTVKPKFEQVGPYRYMMDLMKINISWNDNGTVTYQQAKFWYFNPDETKGSLQDVVTLLNTPALSAAHVARDWNYVVRKTLSFTLSRAYSTIAVTKTVDEFLFSGFPDALTKMAATFPFMAGRDVPKWDKFGFFYKMNGTSGFDGTFTMGTGIDSIFGQLYEWNHWNQTPYYEGNCGQIDASTGLNYDLSNNEDTIKLFVADLCRGLTLRYIGDQEYKGIPARKYIIDDYVLDNGTKYPENLCYHNNGVPSGVFNMSACRFGSPNFFSLPHFYQADPYYTSLVEGLEPEENKHEFYVIVEPNTGIPLEVTVRLQINFLLHPVDNINLYEKVPNVLFPVMWFEQKVTVPDDQVSDLKLLLNVPAISLYLGAVLVSIGVIGLIYLTYMTIHDKDVKRKKQSEEDVPLNQNGASIKS